MTSRLFLFAPLRYQIILSPTRSSPIDIHFVLSYRLQNATKEGRYHHARSGAWKDAMPTINIHRRTSPQPQATRSRPMPAVFSSLPLQIIHRQQMRKYSSNTSGAFHPSTPLFKHQAMPPRPKPPPDEELDESFLKGSGPGGQKINKTNSAVQLKHLPTGIVVKCQETRSRSQNRKIARQLLADKLDNMLHGDQSRSAIVADFKRKKRASSAKKSRRKHRDVGEDGEGVDEEGMSADGEQIQTDEQRANSEEKNNRRQPGRSKVKANIVEIRK